ncbi:outer membrane beta-barrel protein [Novosphingobium soli]|uniref:Outer membrane beta-barrel protein n=1 Tax=Novosphingobium soli TaxID=574956 RepID=A0ABV6CY17_9SPHN
MKRRHSWAKGKAGPCLVGLLGTCAAPQVLAQDRVRDPSGRDMPIAVQTRARPETDPVPFHLGSFTVIPFAAATLTYDDNVYATRSDRVGDALASLAGALTARSAWSRHAVSLDLDGALTRGLSQDAEDTQTYRGLLAGRLDLGTTTALTASAGYARAYEARGSIGDTTLRGPRIAYHALELDARLRRSSGRVILEAEAGLDAFRYAPRSNAAGVRSTLRDRDYTSWHARLRTGYAFAPGVAAFAEGSYNRARYPEDTTALDRGSHGWSLRGGLEFGVSRLVRGRAALGYQDQRYADPAFPRIRGLDFAAALEWNPTRLLTLAVDARRTIQRSPLVGVAGIRQTRFGARADYELRRSVLLSARLDRATSDFAGTPRVQKDLVGGLGIDWLANHHLRLGGEATFQRTRTEGVPGRAFDRRRVSVSLRYAF